MAGKSAAGSLRFVHGLWVGLLAPIIAGAVLYGVTIAWAKHARGLVKTEIVLFHPTGYTEVATDLRVVKRGSGECFVNLSVADGGIPDAHRCFSKNLKLILDPCWEGGGRGNEAAVVCAADPWSRDVVQLHVTKWMISSNKPPFVRILDPASPAYAHYEPRQADFSAPPWALQLANGDRCLFATGTADVVAGLRANYVCDKGSAIGMPLRREKVWTIRYQTNQNAEARDISVRTVWF